MKEEKDKLRDFMQGVFQDYEVAPDPEEWSRIEKTLSKVKSRKLMMWVIWSSAACLFLLLALYTGGILNRSEVTTNRTAVTEHKTDKTPSLLNAKSSAKESVQAGSEKKPTPTTLSSENINLRKVKSIAAAKESKKNNGVKTNLIATLKPEQLNTEKADKKSIQKVKATELINALLATKQTLPVVTSDKAVNIDIAHFNEFLNTSERSNLLVHAIIARPVASIANLKPAYDRSKDFINAWPTTNNDKRNDLDLLASSSPSMKFNGLSLSNSSGLIVTTTSQEMMSYSGAFASQLASNMFTNSVKVFDNSYLASVNIGNLFRNNNRDYLPPITFGLNINLSLQDNWSIETGIQYTRLQSNGSVSINSSSAVQITTSFGYKVKENLYYLGVPVIVNYNLYKKRKTSLYLSAGISIEKGLIAKYEAIPEDNFPGMSPIYSHNTIKGLQYSMNGGLGISYKFIRHFEVFGQPSMTYYFISDRENTTIYNVHPMIFNLRTGIRYTIK